MRAVLAAGAPEAEVLAGKAEAIPAGEAAFNAVVGSSSWHWVDEARAVPEVARVLKPGGTFGLLWSGTDRSVDWMRALWAGGIPVDQERAAAMDAGRRRRHAVDLGAGAPFTEPEVQVVRWIRPMTADELLGMAATYSEVIIMEPEVRRAHLDAMAQFLHDQPLPVTSGGIDVPMRCICWRTIRT
jgi:SAM-dependent methyltransferase